MQRKLTPQEIKMLRNLYNDKDLQFKGLLRQFILGNTYKPKYKIGDFVKITDLSTRIYGNVAKEIKCQITEINYFLREKGEEYITYSAIALDQDGNDYFMCAEESLNGKPQKRHITKKCKDNINVIKKKSKYSQSTDF